MTEPPSWIDYEAAAIGEHFGGEIRDALQERDDRIETLDRENTLLRERLHELEPSNGLLVEDAA